MATEGDAAIDLDFLSATPIRRMPIAPADLCHPTIARAPFTREGWIFELKHDGFRALARKERTAVQLLSRSGRSMATAFPEVVAALAKLPGDVVLDAELIVPAAVGRSDFEELRRRSSGEALFREIARHDQEGIVAKRLEAPYRAGRQPTWLKIKNKEYSRRVAVDALYR